MPIEFTKEQQSVIDARKSNILVSAAAGSGKTAVLVERIIQLMAEGTDIDHLLVVTFTRAAASQMKEKITAAIQERLLQNPDDQHFQRQETLIHNAQITTIDSFCQYVLKNNFNTIGIDPGFRVGDEGELKLLMEEVMSDLLEEEYQKAKGAEDSDFLFCADFFAQGNDDKILEKYINDLFNFARSTPWPLDWIADRSHDYKVSPEDFDQLPWVKFAMEMAGNIVKEAYGKATLAEKVILKPDGPYPYADVVEADKDSLASLLDCKDYDSLYLKARSISFDNLPQCRDKSVDGEKSKYVQGLRKDIKALINDKLIKNFVPVDKETACRRMEYCDRAIRELCRLSTEFYTRFQQEKILKHLIDFNDMEHFALEILLKHPDADECVGLNAEQILAKCTPTAVALEYRDYFKEVLIDEYQDSNSLQEMILTAVSGDDPAVSDRFMVGDVKQSIYKFRLARPEIFMEKFHSYERTEGARDRRIDLHKNFRSRSQVLDITNYVFEKIMGSDLGGVDYDEDARLQYGASYEEPAMNVVPELLLIDGAAEDDDSGHEVSFGTMGRAFSELTPKEKEAYTIAMRINSLMEENPALRFKDMVILLRSPSSWSSVLKTVLEDCHIPAYIESKTGYFESYEVATLLNFLAIIDNPRQDIQLVSVLKSHLAGFTDEELARIRIAIDANEELSGSDSFYIGMRGLLEESEGPRDALLAKIRSFCDFLEELRDMSTYVPVHDLLQVILDRTGFEDVAAALPYGHQRKANIELLLNNALSFEKSSFKGLFHFVRYIEHMKFIEMDYGEAGTIDENADVVRIMSIHKSKGLEFPVVFLAGLSNKLNFRDGTGNLILDMDFGIGVKYINSDLRVKNGTLRHVATARKIVADSLGEEIRVLYVGMTRAKEKLIMSAYVSNVTGRLKKEIMKASPGEGKESLLSYTVRKNAGSYLDLVLPALIDHPSMIKAMNRLELDTSDIAGSENGANIPELTVSTVGDKDVRSSDLESRVKEEMRLKEFAEGETDPELSKELAGRFALSYQHGELKGLFTKTTVTELKKKLLEQEGEFSSLEAPFAKDISTAPEEVKGLTGAERGTAYHRIMELLDDEIFGDEELMRSEKGRIAESLLPWLKKKAEAGVIPSEYEAAVKPSDVAVFLKTELGQRMGAAYRRGELMREKPFMMGVSASELDKKFPEDEMVLVQGIVDAWFLEEGDIVLMDYKTDKVKTAQELKERYRIQLDYYKKALEAATGKKVKEVFIYSFSLGKEFEIKY